MKKLDLAPEEVNIILEALKLKEASLRRAINASSNDKIRAALNEELSLTATLQLQVGSK